MKHPSDTETKGITTDLSQKLRILSFILIVLVVYIHTDYPEYAHFAASRLMRTLITDNVASIAVPLFYMISGFLFFRSSADTLSAIGQKMKKRATTLLIPFIIGALVYPACFIALELCSAQTLHFANGSYLEAIATQPWYQTLWGLFVDRGMGSPYAFHLWFLRDLIVLVVLSPLLYYLRQRLGLWSIPLLLALAIAFPTPSLFGSAFWFVLGSLVLLRLTTARYYLFVVPLAILAITQHYTLPPWLSRLSTFTMLFCGIALLWNAYDLLAKRCTSALMRSCLHTACQYTFFIYLFHVPAVIVMIKGIVWLIGANAWGYTLSYLLSPWLLAVCLIGVGAAFKRGLPRLYAVVVGGR